MSRSTTELRELAHDMRNALSGMYAYVQVLELALAKPGLEQELQITKTITELAQKMDALISERVRD